MHDDLYFIPLIEAALDQPDRQAALRAAFTRIRRMGQQPRYRRGYRQFLHWMQITAGARQDLETGGLTMPTSEMLERPAEVELVIEHHETPLATMRLDPAGAKKVVRGLTPGGYRFRLDTGRLLWDGSISAQGEFVSHPEPGQPLRMAAATTVPAGPAHEMELLAGALTLRLGPDGPLWRLEIESARQQG